MPQYTVKEPNYLRERLYVNDGKIIGDPNQVVKTRSSYRNISKYVAFLSQLEPKNVKKKSLKWWSLDYCYARRAKSIWKK